MNADKDQNQVLTGNLAATTDVNPELERLRFELTCCTNMLESAEAYKPEEDSNVKTPEQMEEAVKAKAREVKACKEERDTAQANLDGYAQRMPVPIVTIGYMPARKLTEIKRKQIALVAMDIDDEQMEKASELDREIVAWGVKGHRNIKIRGEEIPYGAATTTYKGATYTLAGPVTVDAYERMDWLKPLAAAIGAYNNLTEEKKSRSASTSGAGPETSAATSA